MLHSLITAASAIALLVGVPVGTWMVTDALAGDTEIAAHNYRYLTKLAAVDPKFASALRVALVDGRVTYREKNALPINGDRADDIDTERARLKSMI